LHLVIVESAEIQPMEGVRQSPLQNKNKPEKKERGLERLLKKQASLRERLAALKGSEGPKQQAQATKLGQKLSYITAEIETHYSDAAVQQSAEQRVLESVVSTKTLALPVETEFDKRQLKEASQKFFEMRRKIHKEQKKMRAMKEVVRALNILARHGTALQSPVLVGEDQAQIAKASFIASKQDLVLQKQELKQLAVFFKQLHKQKKISLKANKRKSLKKAHRRHCGEFDTEKDVVFEFQDKVKKHRKEKGVKHVEKSKRKEEKAAKKAQKYALEASKQEDSPKLIEKAKKYEEKASKQAEKAKKYEEKVARKAEKCEEKAARKAEKEKRRGQPVVPCVDQAQ